MDDLKNTKINELQEKIEQGDITMGEVMDVFSFWRPFMEITKTDDEKIKDLELLLKDKDDYIDSIRIDMYKIADILKEHIDIYDDEEF